MLKDLHAVEAMRGIDRYPGKADNRIYRLRSFTPSTLEVMHA